MSSASQVHGVEVRGEQRVRHEPGPTGGRLTAPGQVLVEPALPAHGRVAQR